MSRGRRRPVLFLGQSGVLALLLALTLGCQEKVVPVVAADGLPPRDGVAFDWRLASNTPREGMVRLPRTDDDGMIYVSEEIIVTSADVERIRKQMDRRGKDTLIFMFNEEGAQKMADATARPKGMWLALVEAEQVVFAAPYTTPLGEFAPLSGSSDRIDELYRHYTGESGD